MTCDVFISYRRDGGDMTAMYIYQALKERGYSVFYDLEVLRAGKFNEALLDNIRQCKDFLLILSPHALDRCADEKDWVRLELEEALRCKKNIVPILLEGFTFPEELPPQIDEVRYRNGLGASTEYFSESINRLCARYLESKPRKKPKPLVIAVLVMVLLIAAGGAWFLTRSPAPPQTQAAVQPEAAAQWPRMRSGVLTPECQDPDLYRLDRVLGSETLIREQVKTVTFLPTLEAKGENAWDVSLEGDGSVMAWTRENGALYDLFIAGEGGVAFTNPLPDENHDFSLFTGYVNLEKVDFGNCVDASRLTTLRAMFEQCQSLESVDLTGLDTSRVTDMCGLFMDCQRLKKADVSGLDTSSVLQMSAMFAGCHLLESLDLSGWDTSRVELMDEMFNGCENLTELVLPHGFITEKTTDAVLLFNDCRRLRSISTEGWNTGSLTSMEMMFCACSSLTQLDVSHFDTSRAINMSCMFNECSSLLSLDVSGFDTSRVTDMSYMFAYCPGLIRLDVENWNLSRLRNSENMFLECGCEPRLPL